MKRKNVSFKHDSPFDAPLIAIWFVLHSPVISLIGFFVKRGVSVLGQIMTVHEEFIKWNHFPRYWPFVRGIHRSPVNSPHKGQSRGDLMFSLICVWINDWVNNREVGELRRHRGHYDVTVMRRNSFIVVRWLTVLIHHMTYLPLLSNQSTAKYNRTRMIYCRLSIYRGPN